MSGFRGMEPDLCVCVCVCVCFTKTAMEQVCRSCCCCCWCLLLLAAYNEREGRGSESFRPKNLQVPFPKGQQLLFNQPPGE